MPGPYDLYGNIEEERSVSSRLPFNIGGSGVGAWLPELGTYAVGALAFRYGIKSGLGNKFFGGPKSLLTFGAGYTPAEKAIANAVGRTAKLGGSRSSINSRVRQTLLDAQATRATTTIQTTMRIEEQLSGSPNRVRPNALWGERFVNAQQNVPAVRFGNGTTLPLNDPQARLRLGKIAANTRRGSNFAQWGNNLKGFSKALGAMAVFGGMIDLGTSLGEAAIDWRPRRDSPSPFEFGNVYTEITGAYTQRQRAIMAIHDSQLTSRAAIGNEASFIHGA
jgi:hypothetical protein